MSTNQIIIEAFQTIQESMIKLLELTEDASYRFYTTVYDCYNINQSDFKNHLIEAIDKLKYLIDKSYVLGNDPEIDAIYKGYVEKFNIFREYLASDGESNVNKDDVDMGMGQGRDDSVVSKDEIERLKVENAKLKQEVVKLKKEKKESNDSIKELSKKMEEIKPYQDLVAEMAEKDIYLELKFPKEYGSFEMKSKTCPSSSGLFIFDPLEIEANHKAKGLSEKEKLERANKCFEKLFYLNKLKQTHKPPTRSIHEKKREICKK